MDLKQPSRVGVLLREWRRRRRLSQLELALLADTSARHLSCVETGRARPSRTMVLRLSAALDVPLRERATPCCWPPTTRPRTGRAVSTTRTWRRSVPRST
ncbi:helix-turn-helix domain-containing protein [Streptomyces sp. x-80]|uniref:helix-turn-helix domain-containing protein n=1 Tax=Streptomyces sp. x-80 TaxID=2789282 RepID=UPI00397EA8E9